MLEVRPAWLSPSGCMRSARRPQTIGPGPVREGSYRRLWHGRVPSAKARSYREFLNGRAIPDYRSAPGNVSVHVLERTEGEVTHFVTMTFWESLAAIRAFAGEDAEAAKYYPEDESFLLEYEPRVVHYEVVGQS